MYTIANKSRAGYFRKRRETMKQFNVMLPKDKIEKLENKLTKQNITKVAWFEKIVDEEISQN